MTAANEKLLFCPFCDCNDALQERNEHGWPVVRCSVCGACGPCTGHKPEDAATAWNRRAQPAEAVDEAKERETVSRLIKLAAQMVQGVGMPDIDEWPWPTRATSKLWSAAVKAQRDAVEQCRLWGIEVKQVADELLARARGGN